MKMRSNIIECVNALLSIYPEPTRSLWFCCTLCNTPLLKLTPPLQFNEFSIKTCLKTCERGNDEGSFLKDQLIISQCLSLNNWSEASLIPAHVWPDQSGCKGTNTSIMTLGFEPLCEKTIFVNMYKAIKFCLFAYGSTIHILLIAQHNAIETCYM